ncbi:MAG: hypothetical protein HS116_17755 [Planctomycetes bacterium]|nr:hypothetical protein [Planctomycetota bacterium]
MHPHQKEIIEVLNAYVPEILGGSVEVREVAQLPSVGCMIALRSKNRYVDEIDVIVGARARRLRAILERLPWTNVYFVRWKPTWAEYLKSCLEPARVLRLDAHETKSNVSVVVSADDWASLCGPQCARVRLAEMICRCSIRVLKAGARDGDDESPAIGN